MGDNEKSRELLLQEIEALRKQIEELRAVETERTCMEEALRESEKCYRMLFESAGDAIFILDAEGKEAGRIVAANQAAALMHGYIIEELLTLYITDLDMPDSAKEAAGRIQRITKGEWIKAEVTHRRKDGMVFPVEVSAGLLELGDHRYVLAFDRDITERKRFEEALKESEEKYRSLVESTQDSIYLVDRDCRYLFMNRQHLVRLGVLGEQIQGRHYGEFHTPDETEWFTEKVTTVFGQGESCNHEHRSLRDGRYFLLTLSPVKAEDGSVKAVTIVSKDISDLKRLEERLRDLSLTDDLTGLYNRRGFFTLAEQQVKRAKRMKKALVIVTADLDGLKDINDSLGHREGDAALVEAATILRETYRGSDIIARIGGDEFAVLTAEEKDVIPEILAARLRKNLELHNVYSKRNYSLSMSVGSAQCYEACPDLIEELLTEADRLMYEEKRGKKKSADAAERY